MTLFYLLYPLLQLRSIIILPFHVVYLLYHLPLTILFIPLIPLIIQILYTSVMMSVISLYALNTVMMFIISLCTLIPVMMFIISLSISYPSHDIYNLYTLTPAMMSRPMVSPIGTDGMKTFLRRALVAP